jgi:hypothetical protein
VKERKGISGAHDATKSAKQNQDSTSVGEMSGFFCVPQRESDRRLLHWQSLKGKDG